MPRRNRNAARVSFDADQFAATLSVPAPGYCPACTPHPRNGHWSPLTSEFLPRSYTNPAGRR